MKNSKSLTGVLLAIHAFGFFASSAAYADPTSRRSRRVASEPKVTTETTTRDLPQEDDQSGTGLTLFLGAGASYYSVLSQNPSIESDKSGLGYQGKLGLTFYSRMLALELDAGWMQSSVSSTRSITTIVGNTTSVSQAQVDTRAGLIEFSPRLRFGDHFELGPSAGVLFGTNASFGNTDAQLNSPVMGGVKAGFAFQTHDLHFRIMAQGQTSLTIPERHVYMGSVGLEIGLPLLKGKTVVRETQVREVEQRESIE